MTCSDFSGKGMAGQGHSKVMATSYKGTLAAEQLNRMGKGKDNQQLQSMLQHSGFAKAFRLEYEWHTITASALAIKPQNKQ